MKKIALLLPLLTALCFCSFAQKKSKIAAPAPILKKPLTHSVYDFWKDVQERAVTHNGQWFGAAINPQEGDGRLLFVNLTTNQTDSIARGGELKFSNDSEFAVFKIKPQMAVVKAAKRAKQKDLPKDSLGIYALNTKQLTKKSAVTSFKVPEKGGNWVAYLQETTEQKTRSDTAKVRATKAKKESVENGYGLVWRDLKSGTEKKFAFVTDYEVSKNGLRLAFATTGNDPARAGLYVFETTTQQAQLIQSAHPKHRFRKLTFDESGTQLACVADLDTNAKTPVRLPKLMYWKSSESAATVLADADKQPAAPGWLVSGESAPIFAKNGNKLFFGTNPRPILQDTTLLPEEIVNVEVWHWQDAKLQPQQKVTLDRDKKRAYWAVINLDDRKMVQLANEQIPDVELINEGNADFVLASSNVKYSNQHWDWNPKQDVYLISTRDGAKTLVKQKLEATARVSPTGKYLYWFSNPDTAWFAHDVVQNKTIQLTNNQSVRFADEEDDHPDFPTAYGTAGWTPNDESILLYDRFDLWQIVPQNFAQNKKLTNGRADKIQYRYLRLDAEARHVDLTKNLLFKTFDETTKQEGFAQLAATGGQLSALLKGDFKIGNTVLKAKNADRLLFTQETFQRYPDWYATDLSFKNVVRVTDANPQQAQYLWGSVEIVNWRAGDGTPLQGLLYKPENFDPSKKYPMMTYFYEKNTDNFHSHVAPRPIRSYVNYAYFVSNGYLVFVPDIVYQTGYPGQSAYNCVVPGVLSMIDKGFVDKDKIGISGHSWGGYQTAYLITQTNLFKAAEAGAPVANMTSAYGGIRWESGNSRQSQYERTQTRIGGTLWEKPMQYLENSPLFHAPKIQTPVLMMHNDDDGAVPWYQGIEFYMALKRLDKPVWMLNYNGEKHGLTKRQNMKDFTVRLYQYFDHYLKDAPAPAWLTEGLPMLEKGINQRLTPAQTPKSSAIGGGLEK